MEEANTMFDVLDENKDKRVTESDFEALAVKYLCQTPSFSTANNYGPSSALQGSQVSQNSHYSSNRTSNRTITTQANPLQGSNVSRYLSRYAGIGPVSATNS
jgi:hypothetical protein